MKTVSYSLDQETADGIERIAKAAKMSRSDVVRQMYARMQLEDTLTRMQDKAAPFLDKHGLKTEDDIAAYFKSKS